MTRGRTVHQTKAVLRRLGKLVWLRASVFTLIAIVVALAAGFVGTLFPYRLVIDLGQNSVGSVLQIIASSMLAVTTFSLATMVTAYSSATTTATPRATQLLVEDRTSQNALSTFIGGFTFSLVGIIALSTGYYGDQGRTILFIATLVMIALIVITLLRWIAHLATFGRVADVIDRVEGAATRVLLAYAESPALGARPFGEIPVTAEPVLSPMTGYVTFIDLPALERAAARASIDVHVLAMPGSIADTTAPLAVASRVDPELSAAVAACFRVSSHRDFEQDPRLGVIALSEIGSRALSPATNDPGTAIDVIAALHRVFAGVLARRPSHTVEYPHVHVRPTKLDDLIVDAFRPLARDGAALVEVQIRVQKCLASLARLSPEHSALFREAATSAAGRAEAALTAADAADLAVVRSALRWHAEVREQESP